MKKRLYVAYGSNLNLLQMKYRCPTAKLYGIGVIRDYELQFKGSPVGAYATITPKKGGEVPAAVWDIKMRDEMSLDRYEGYPSHYFKMNVPVELEDKTVEAMVYIMNLKMDFGLPTRHYYETVQQGYLDCHLDTKLLEQALDNSIKKFYFSYGSNEPIFFEQEQEDEIDELEDAFTLEDLN